MWVIIIWVIEPISHINQEQAMPIFEFRCLNCGNVFEELFTKSDSDKEIVISCPQCKGQTVERVISRTSYVMGSGPEGKQPKITTKSCGSSNQCMTLELPGPTKS